MALISDQSAGERGIFVDFFGRPASSFRGPGLFAQVTGAPIVPIFIVREGYMKHRVVFCPRIVIEPSGDVGQDITAITREYTIAIEKMIAENPDHWIWQHKRWKVDPPGVKSV